MGNIQRPSRDQFMLKRSLRKNGYDWWWHSFTAYHETTGKAQPFFIEFFTCNPALGGAEPVFGQDGKGNKPSYLMVKCGAWGEGGIQLHRFFGWDNVNVKTGTPFAISAADCSLDEFHTTGEVEIDPADAAAHPEWMCDGGHIKWDLKIEKKVSFHVGYGANRFFRFLNAFEMVWHAEGIKTAYTGWVEYNGEKYLVRPEDCYGYADKNWGSDFTSPWVWLSSNNLTSKLTGKKLENSVFDIGGGCPKVYFVALKRKLLSLFWYEGENYEFNFSKLWTLTHTVFDCQETETQIVWHVEQWNTKGKMVTDITCEKKDMLFVNYEAPNGKKLHNRLWNGGNGKGEIKLYRKRHGKYELIDEIIAENIGCEYGEYDKIEK